MAIVSFNATARENTGKGAARTLRSQGQVPAVIYGHGREPQSLSLSARDLDKMLGHIQPESTVIEVTVGGHTSKTLIREIQRHPIKRQILHVDFQALVAGEKVIVSIPIVLKIGRRRVGKECRFRWSRDGSKKKSKIEKT